MRIKLYDLIRILVLSFLISGCKDKVTEAAPLRRVEVAGQMFIVQRNRVNLPLGAERIYIIPKERLIRVIRDFRIQDEALGTLIEHRRRLRADVRELDSCIIKLSRMQSSNATDAAIHEELKKKRDLIAQETERAFPYSDLGRAPSSANGFLEYVYQRKLSSVLAGLAVAESQTDAEGRYQIEYEVSGKAFMVAHSSRAMLGSAEDEKYYWIIELDQSNQNLFLTSNNLVRQDDISILLAETTYSQEAVQRRVSKIQSELPDTANIMKLCKLISRVEEAGESRMNSRKHLDQLTEDLTDVEGEIEKLQKLEDEARATLKKLKQSH